MERCIIHCSCTYKCILSSETCFEGSVGCGNVKKKRGVCIYIRPLQTQDGTYIDKVCKKPLSSQRTVYVPQVVYHVTDKYMIMTGMGDKTNSYVKRPVSIELCAV